MKENLNIDMPNFGLEVKKRLLEIDITQSAIAERLGISRAYLGDILKDNRYAPDIRRKIICILDELESRCKPVEK